MDYRNNQTVGVRPELGHELRENTRGGPLVVNDPNATVQSYSTTHSAPRRVPARFRLEGVGFWIIVAAAALVLLVLLGFVLRPVMGGLIAGTWMGAFVGMLTMLNLPRPSGWANAVLGRRVFPV